MSGLYCKNTDGTYSQLVQLSGSTAAIPVDIQGSLVPDNEALPTKKIFKTVQTHNAVSVAATTGTSSSAWIDCSGFSDIAIISANDASTAWYVDLWWSADGANNHGFDAIIPSGVRQYGSGLVPIKARYAKVTLKNTDAAAHTMSAWAYLKG